MSASEYVRLWVVYFMMVDTAVNGIAKICQWGFRGEHEAKMGVWGWYPSRPARSRGRAPGQGQGQGMKPFWSWKPFSLTSIDVPWKWQICLILCILQTHIQYIADMLKLSSVEPPHELPPPNMPPIALSDTHFTSSVSVFVDCWVQGLSVSLMKPWSRVVLVLSRRWDQQRSSRRRPSRPMTSVPLTSSATPHWDANSSFTAPQELHWVQSGVFCQMFI